LPFILPLKFSIPLISIYFDFSFIVIYNKKALYGDFIHAAMLSTNDNVGVSRQHIIQIARSSLLAFAVALRTYCLLAAKSDYKAIY